VNVTVPKARRVNAVVEELVMLYQLIIEEFRRFKNKQSGWKSKLRTTELKGTQAFLKYFHRAHESVVGFCFLDP
jgi:hypothetical protein